MEDNIYRVAPDRPNFNVTSGIEITITKIISNNNVDLLLYPSLTLVIKSIDGINIHLQRSLASYVNPFTKNERIIDINETVDVGDGLLIEVNNRKNNVDFNLSILYSINWII